MLTHSCGYELLMYAMFKLVRGVVENKWPQQKKPKKRESSHLRVLL